MSLVYVISCEDLASFDAEARLIGTLKEELSSVHHHGRQEFISRTHDVK